LFVAILIAHVDDGLGLPLADGQGEVSELVDGKVTLLQESVSIEEQLAAAARLGSGETDFEKTERGAGQMSTANLEVAVGKAAQVDLLSSLDKPATTDTADFFTSDLSKWEAQKRAVIDSASETNSIITSDLRNQLETTKELSTVKTGTVVSKVASDPMADFKQEFARGNLDDGSPAVHMRAQEPEVNQLATDSGRGWLTSALAEWGKEQDAELGSPVLSNAPVLKLHGAAEDLGESANIGAEDSTSALAMTTKQALVSDVESAAQEAAAEVEKSTMDAVAQDFLFTEKAITHQLAPGAAPQLTLESLENAGGKAEAEKRMVDAKANLKQMNAEAEKNYEAAVTNAHKKSQELLGNELSGLKIQLRNEEDKILQDAAIAKQKVHDQMAINIKASTLQELNRMKEMLPAKLKAAKLKAETEARKVASLAISQITHSAQKIRKTLDEDLGEAAGKVRDAEEKLKHSDNTPSLALKNAVDLQTEKSKYTKLKSLAQAAYTQQKAKAAQQITLAEENAKLSVMLAVKDVEKRELKKAQDVLKSAGAKITAEEGTKAESTQKRIDELAQQKIKEERERFKGLVDAAVQMAPSKEAEMRHQAEVQLEKAKIAARKYEERIEAENAPKDASGQTISKEMAVACVDNPSGCNLFTLKTQNIGAAAKYAESEARKAKRLQLEAKERVAQAMASLNQATAVMEQTAHKAEDLDEKETRIRLARLQLNEARAAAAFHSAAKAHLQTELVHGQLRGERADQDDQLAQFNAALREMSLTSNEDMVNKEQQAETAKVNAFGTTANAAKSLLNAVGPIF